MTKEFIPYDLALELKALGFDEPCLRVGNPNGHTMWKWIEVDGEPPTVSINDVIQVPYGEEWTQIPTFSQAFRFFREKYNTLVTLYSNASGYLFEWHDAIGGTHRGWSEYEGPNDSGVWDTYQEAEIAAIVKLIEIIKNK
jgi:hypothetical protein